MKDIHGQALYDYYFHHSKARLWIHNEYGPKEEMPIDVYFRNLKNMTEMELFALHQCKGKVLDIGAGAGSHALVLQEQGLEITALEISPLAIEVMKHRGVKRVIVEDIFNYRGEQYDTLLLLMNGIGLAGTIAKLKIFLQHVKQLLNDNGQLIFESSNVAYLYNDDVWKMETYYGEIMYQYEYKKQKGDWFKWLYVDKKTLNEVASVEGYKTEILLEDDYDQYLVRLTLK